MHGSSIYGYNLKLIFNTHFLLYFNKGLSSKISHLKRMNVSMVILSGSALNESDPQSIKNQFETEPLKELRKKLENEGIEHVNIEFKIFINKNCILKEIKLVMNIPYSLLNLKSKGLEVVNNWVKNLADGIIVSDFKVF